MILIRYVSTGSWQVSETFPQLPAAVGQVVVYPRSYGQTSLTYALGPRPDASEK